MSKVELQQELYLATIITITNEIEIAGSMRSAMLFFVIFFVFGAILLYKLNKKTLS